LYRLQRGVACGRCGPAAQHPDLQNAEKRLGENWRQGAYRGRNGVLGRNRMDTAETTVRLCGILHRLQIVGDRDDRKQNQDQHGQGDYLRPPAGACVARVSPPDAQNSHG